MQAPTATSCPFELITSYQLIRSKQDLLFARDRMKHTQKNDDCVESKSKSLNLIHCTNDGFCNIIWIFWMAFLHLYH